MTLGPFSVIHYLMYPLTTPSLVLLSHTYFLLIVIQHVCLILIVTVYSIYTHWYDIIIIIIIVFCCCLLLFVVVCCCYCLLHLKEGDEIGSKLSLERKEVWGVQWAQVYSGCG